MNLRHLFPMCFFKSLSGDYQTPMPTLHLPVERREMCGDDAVRQAKGWGSNQKDLMAQGKIGHKVALICLQKGRRLLTDLALPPQGENT